MLNKGGGRRRRKPLCVRAGKGGGVLPYRALLGNLALVTAERERETEREKGVERRESTKAPKSPTGKEGFWVGAV